MILLKGKRAIKVNSLDDFKKDLATQAETFMSMYLYGKVRVPGLYDIHLLESVYRRFGRGKEQYYDHYIRAFSFKQGMSGEVHNDGPHDDYYAPLRPEIGGKVEKLAIGRTRYIDIGQGLGEGMDYDSVIEIFVFFWLRYKKDLSKIIKATGEVIRKHEQLPYAEQLYKIAFKA